ncbi:MAG: O-antigen ligase family protein [Lachnospiraceae bacterium]|nr:O-antigen ligase family protein [Lachnospiraceae bacterium]
MRDKKDKLLLKEIDLSFITDNLEDILTKALTVIAISFPAIELICTMLGYPNLLMHTLLRTIGYVGFTFLLIVFLNNKKHKMVLSDMLILLSTLFTILSVVFSLDIDSSIAGASVDLAEDFGQVIGYYVIFFAATHVIKADNKKLIMIGMLIASLLHTIPAILQRFGIWPWELYEADEFPVAYGLTPHHNFYGGIAVIFSALTAMIYITKKTKKYITWYIYAVICFVTALFSSSRLAWVGLIAYLCFIICIEIYAKKKKAMTSISIKRYGVLLVTFAAVFVAFYFFDKGISSQIAESTNEIANKEVASLGTGRMEIWMIGLYGVKNHLLTGLGLDNYIYAYELYPGENLWYPAIKGHNEYIHTLVTQGLPALAVYLILCGFVVALSCKRLFDKEEDQIEKAIIYILLIVIVGYFCQAMFNSSVTTVAPYKWLVMGLLLPRCKQKELKCLRKKRNEDEE